MSVFRGIYNFLSHVKNFFKKEDKEFLPRDKIIVLRHDGTWTISDAKSKSQQSKPPPNIPVFPVSWCDYDFLPTEGETLTPPDFFPKKAELKQNLDKCLDAGAISSCTHTIKRNNVYVLEIEVPCSENYDQSHTQFKSFIRVMESTYNFDVLQKECCTSKISSQKFHKVTFQYDPRTKIFTNKN